MATQQTPTTEDAIKHLDAQIEKAKQHAGTPGFNPYFFIAQAEAAKSNTKSPEGIAAALKLTYDGKPVVPANVPKPVAE